MTNRYYLYTLALCLLLGLASGCKQKGAQDANIGDAQELSAKDGIHHRLDLEQSTIEWKGSKLIGKSHNGSIKIREGALLLNADKALVGGEFSIDMTTITVNDLTGDDKAKLEGHLKSHEFFDVAKYPAARFVITDVIVVQGDTTGITHRIQGNLTMCGQTKGIDFRAAVQIPANGQGATAQARFNIDRTQWGIVYGTEKSLKDQLINNDIELTIALQAE